MSRFPVLWVVMVRFDDGEFVIETVHETRSGARMRARTTLKQVGKGNAYVQKFGPIS